MTVEHSQVETTPYFGNFVEGKFDVGLYPITVAADEVTAQHQSHLTTKKAPISYSRHNDEKLDDLWDQQARTLDLVKRKALVHELERHLIAQNYSLSVNWWQRIIVHHKKLKGWHFSPSPFQGQDLLNVWLDE